MKVVRIKIGNDESTVTLLGLSAFSIGTKVGSRLMKPGATIVSTESNGGLTMTIADEPDYVCVRDIANNAVKAAGWVEYVLIEIRPGENNWYLVGSSENVSERCINELMNHTYVSRSPAAGYRVMTGGRGAAASLMKIVQGIV